MTALEMRVRISRLMRRHSVVSDPLSIPLAPPTDHAQVLEGYASTTDLDLDRVKIRPYAFGWPLLIREMPPLYHKHDASQVAGEIEDLSYDDRGNLLVRARVDHPQARRCGAFSIGATVVAYEMKNADRPDFFALITQADLTEISLTDAPANPRALVLRRHRVSALSGFYDAVTEKVRCLTELTKMMKEDTAHARAA